MRKKVECMCKTCTKIWLYFWDNNFIYSEIFQGNIIFDTIQINLQMLQFEQILDSRINNLFCSSGLWNYSANNSRV